MKTAAQRIREHLADPQKVSERHRLTVRRNGFDEFIIRHHFTMAHGAGAVSIQQGAGHYCNKDSNTFEIWCCPHRPILDPYAIVYEGPYGHVPFDVLVRHVEQLEAEARAAGAIDAEDAARGGL
jgi:hypothetical protein